MPSGPNRGAGILGGGLGPLNDIPT